MDKIILGTAAAVLFFLCGCFRQDAGKEAPFGSRKESAEIVFSISYNQAYSSKGYKQAITVNSRGESEYRFIDSRSGELRDYLSLELSRPELDELRDLLAKDNAFFSLPADLSSTGCHDGSIEHIEASLGDKSHKAGGYCVQDKTFRSICQKLHEYIDKYRQSD